MRKHKTWICGILFMIGLLQGMTPLAANAAELPVSYENRAAIEAEIHELIAQNRNTTPSVSVIVFDKENYRLGSY